MGTFECKDLTAVRFELDQQKAENEKLHEELARLRRLVGNRETFLMLKRSVISPHWSRTAEQEQRERKEKEKEEERQQRKKQKEEEEKTRKTDLRKRRLEESIKNMEVEGRRRCEAKKRKGKGRQRQGHFVIK